MSRDEQIEKMANDIEKSHWKIVQDFMGCHINSDDMAEYLYNAGYRKQSVGEWKDMNYYIHNKRIYKCSECSNSEAKDNLTSANYCPKCGAKMKGGAE